MRWWEEHKVGSRDAGPASPGPRPNTGGNYWFKAWSLPPPERAHTSGLSARVSWKERGGSWSSPRINVQESFNDLVWESWDQRNAHQLEHIWL